MAGFFAMGGYGAFVWPAWLAGFIVIAAVTLTGYRRLDAARRALKNMEKKGRRKKGKHNG